MDTKAEIVRKGHGKNLIYQDYSYRRDSKFHKRQHWRCNDHHCPGRVHTINETPYNTVTVVHFVPHDHMPNALRALTTKIKAKLVELATMPENLAVPLQDIYDNYMQQPEIQQNTETLPLFSSCRSQMQRARTLMEPVVVNDVELEQSLSQLDLLIHFEEDILIMGSEENLKLLATSSTIYMDGSFKLVPTEFTKLLSIHGMYVGNVIPLIFCLMKNKTKDTYCNVFEILKKKLYEKDLKLEPDRVVSDFEEGQIEALRIHLPTSTHSGCLFYYTQSVWNKMMKCGVCTVYNSDENIKELMKKLLALPFLPQEVVAETFYQIECEPVIQKHACLQILCAYFEHTWIDGAFPVPLWNQYGQRMKTNFEMEGWHPKSIGKKQPTKQKFIKYLKDLFSESELTKGKARIGEVSNPLKKRYRQLDKKINKMTQEFEQKNTSKYMFLLELTHVVQELRL